MKIAVVILTFNVHYDFVPDYLLATIQGWQRQIIDADIDILFVDNLSSDKFKSKMAEVCNENDYQCISIPNARYTMSICKNIGWLWMGDCGSLEEYDYFVFCSDDTAMAKNDDLKNIIDSFSHASGIVYSFVSTDSFPKGVENNKQKFVKQFKKLLKQAKLNLASAPAINIPLEFYFHSHFVVYSKEYFKKYGFKDPDILWNYGTDAVMTYLCSAVNMECQVCPNVCLSNGRQYPHKKTLHVQPPGSLINVSPVTLSGQLYQMFQNNVSLDDIFLDETKIGLGFMCLSGYPSYAPDVSNYDNNKHKHPDVLHSHIINKLFLPDHILDYRNILLNEVRSVRVRNC